MKEKDVEPNRSGHYDILLVNLARRDFVAALRTLDEMSALPGHNEDRFQSSLRQAEQTAMLCRRLEIVRVVNHWLRPYFSLTS